MALVLNEEQQMLRDSAAAFIKERSPVSALRGRRDKGEDWSPELWAEMTAMGWTGIAIAEEHGGLDFGYVGAGLLLEECGRTLASSPLLSSSLVCSSLVWALGSNAQKKTLLPAIASGESIFALAHSETDRFDPASIATTAVPDAGGYLLNGCKMHVIDGSIASHLIVVARQEGKPDGQDGICLFVMDNDNDRISITNTTNADSRATSHIAIDSLHLDASAMLAATGMVWPALQRALDIGAALSAAELLGLSQEAFQRTLEYLRNRTQFGVPVGSFQALQHRAAQLFCELELCKSAVLSALQALDNEDSDRSLLASMAKAKLAKTAKLAANEAIQMHGGIGMTDEFEIGFFLKRAAVVCQEYGDYYYHADRFARLRGY